MGSLESRQCLALALFWVAALFCSSSQAGAPRWVSAGGSLSEWIVVLGGEERLVGVDSTSQHPASLKALPSIGYQRQLAAEGILALRPQLLVGSEEMGPPPVLEQLRAAGVGIERLSAEPNLETLAANLLRLGELLGEPERARQALADYRQRLEGQQRWIERARQRGEAPGVLLVFGDGGAGLLVAGRETAADWLLQHAGGLNLARHHGYKPLSAEALVALDPAVLVLADRRLEGAAARAALLRHNPALAATRAAREGRLLAIDPTLLVGGLGPRVPDGLAAMAAAFYPSAQALTAEATR